jgi:hypothetical protein
MEGTMPRWLLSMLVAAVVVAACGSSTQSPTPVVTAAPTAAPTASPAPTAAPSAAATVVPSGPFAGQAYALDLPDGWTTFDLKDPSGVAALDAFVAANPEMAGAIEAFKSLPNVRMAVNVALGNVVVSLSLPTGGVPLETLAATFTTQFAAVPGIKEAPVAENVTLPVGPAVHWAISIEANDPSGGGVSTVAESIYLTANPTTAVLVEFVDSAGTGIPQEQQIIQSLRFTP